MTECCRTEVTVGGELTRSLCGQDQTRPRRIRLCSPSPPDRVDAVGTARSSSPSKLAPFPYQSNSGSVDEQEGVALTVIQPISSICTNKTCKSLQLRNSGADWPADWGKSCCYQSSSLQGCCQLSALHTCTWSAFPSALAARRSGPPAQPLESTHDENSQRADVDREGRMDPEPSTQTRHNSLLFVFPVLSATCCESKVPEKLQIQGALTLLYSDYQSTK